jgi:hypothetical protein
MKWVSGRAESDAMVKKQAFSTKVRRGYNKTLVAHCSRADGWDFVSLLVEKGQKGRHE